MASVRARNSWWRVAGVRLSASIRRTEEPGVDGVDLTRVGLSLTFAGGVDGHEANEERIFKVAEQGVQRFLGKGDALGLLISWCPSGKETPVETCPFEKDRFDSLGSIVGVSSGSPTVSDQSI